MASSRLTKRKRFSNSNNQGGQDPATPYGIPIYQLLESLSPNTSSHENGDLATDSPNSLGKRKQISGLSSLRGAQSASKKRKPNAVRSVLLAEQYRPKTFFDLVGNGDGNRQILRWLTFWKPCIFGTPPTLGEDTDELGRPLRKILLIHGPPGIGKTTAGHIIAKQAGFDVLEINASDERGAAIVKDRIHSAVNSHQVNSKRPICIIADEVEGASEHGFVRSLINIIKEDANALKVHNERRATGSQSKSSRKNSDKKGSSLLLRPIIAICNDVWAPSLRSLRPFAEIVQFRKHFPAKLVQRLEDVCVLEKIPLSNRQLMHLAEAYEFDLRACLNALQFGTLNFKQNIPMDSIVTESCEKTDWNVLVKTQFLSSVPASFQQIESCSDMDRLIAGCFTACHSGSYIDDVLKKPVLMGEFMVLADNRRANDEIKSLVPHAFGYLFRSPALSAAKSGAKTYLQPNNNSFGKPPSLFEESRQTKSIVSTMLKEASIFVRSRASFSVALLDLAPFALAISNPCCNHLLTAEDKTRMKVIAGSLLDLGVDLRTEKLENGSFIHKLNPPIELASIQDKENLSNASAGDYVSRSQLKSALRELKKERSGLSRTTVSVAPKKTLASASDANTNITKGKELKEKVSDFFQKANGNSIESSGSKNERLENTQKVWVQYSEGFSNAVRKPITWDELFGK